MTNEVFYHASNIGNLKEILPLSTGYGSGERVCYFTPVRAYALFYLRDMNINHVTCAICEDGVIVYHEQFPSQLETIYKGRSGYLYVCDGDGLIKAHTNGVFAAEQSVSVVDVQFVEDVYAEILEAEALGEVRIIRYETLSDDRKQEITEMMKKYIVKNNFLSSDSLKARFFKDNFQQAREAAEFEAVRNQV